MKGIEVFYNVLLRNITILLKNFEKFIDFRKSSAWNMIKSHLCYILETRGARAKLLPDLDLAAPKTIKFTPLLFGEFFFWNLLSSVINKFYLCIFGSKMFSVDYRSESDGQQLLKYKC